MAAGDATHWWYTARRRVLRAIVKRQVRPPPGARILEIGCGTGHNLAMLGAFGHVDAVELDADARTLATRRLGRPVLDARFPDLAGVERGGYDLVAALDVIEHVEDDIGALAAMRGLLRPGGRVLIAVPAHAWMWSAHDRANHHHRRYSARTLRRALEAAAFHVEHLGPINSLLFPLAIAQRFAAKATGRDSGTERVPPAPLNRAFDRVFGWEAYLVGRVPLPPGLSLVAVASCATQPASVASAAT